MKILLFITLLILVIFQYILIYNIGDFIDLFESFGVEPPAFSEWIFVMSKTKTIWLLPKLNFIINILLIMKEKYLPAVAMIFISYVVIGALLWAMYSPIFSNEVIL